MSANTTTSSNSGGNSPWGWLGLLKWSLAYSDGTAPSSLSPMSEEDKAFLEKVMKEGIIDENERMKEILKQVTEGLDDIRQDNTDQKTAQNEELQDEIENLLQELRDIVEQIDYARAFAAMKGLDFLLGCVTQPQVPKPIQTSCLGILATMASNNPPIQNQLLEMGAIRTLSDLFESSSNDNAFRAKIIQAMSAMVRSYELSEQVFCGVEQARELILEGLQIVDGAQVLQKRTLFFFRALITSDDATRERVRLFAHSVAYVADYLVPLQINPENGTEMDDSSPESAEIREMALALLAQILEQRKSVNTILDRKDHLVTLGVRRVAAMRALTGEQRDFCSVELETWEHLLVLLARAVTDSDDTAEDPSSADNTAEAPLMITAPNPEVVPQ